MFLQAVISVLKLVTNSTNLSNTKGGFVEAKVFYREHAYAYPNNSFRMCGGPEALAYVTIFNKCCVETSLEWQEHYILETNLELSYKIHLGIYLIKYVF